MTEQLIKIGTELSIGKVENITSKGIVVSLNGKRKTVTFTDAEAAICSEKGTQND
tara:strand:- start:1169 stop:1333 length:165 start_codon:yes stop_codon:yes gene_type:complete